MGVPAVPIEVDLSSIHARRAISLLPIPRQLEFVLRERDVDLGMLLLEVVEGALDGVGQDEGGPVIVIEGAQAPPHHVTLVGASRVQLREVRVNGLAGAVGD